MSTHVIESRPLSDDEHAQISDFVGHVRAEVDLPEHVRNGVLELVCRVVDGHDVSLVDSEAMLTPNDAARVVGVSRPLINQILDEGRIPFFETTGGHRKIKARDVLAYIEQRDRIARQLADARANRVPDGEEIATELGLDAATAKRLGFT